jgi:hypothetical protein
MTHKVLRLVSTLSLILAVFGSGLNTQVARAAGPWYVAPGGNDINTCLSPAAACATVNGTLAKPGFIPGDVVNVAIGNYMSSDVAVLIFDKNTTITGGWNANFTTQSGLSTIDGQNTRLGMLVRNGVTATVDHLLVQNAYNGPAILNSGTLTIKNSAVRGNHTSTSIGGGISNTGILVVNNSEISDNTSIYGGGINNSGGQVTLSNSTVSANIADFGGGGIYNQSSGTIKIHNSTISNNTASGGVFGDGGGINNWSGTVTLQNSILASNSATHFSPDCTGFFSLGYNIIGNTSGCFFTSSTGDLNDVNPIIGPLQGNGGLTFTHALLPQSPAIDAGNPADCTDQDGNLLTTDQRGIARPQGTRCDIGAFELEADGGGGGQVTIDIKPGSQTNPINPKSIGKIPVAILSTADFDAPSEVDKTSLTFGRTGDELSLVSCNKNGEDVNRDGLLDLVCQFKTKLTGFRIGDAEGLLKGQTLDGVSIEGGDSVRVLK